MKPRNDHRVMCPSCGRRKLLFKTEKNALNFIKFNGSEVTREGEELRAYYCDGCGGWHISSKKWKKGYDYNTENLINAYKKDKENGKVKLSNNDE